MAAKRTIWAGLDLGSATTKMVVVESLDGEPRIIAASESLTRGVERGVITDFAKASASIGRTVEDAEIMAGFTLKEICLGTAADYSRGINRRGMACVDGGTVRPQHLVTTRRVAVALPYAANERLLAAIPQSYSVDQNGTVPHPLGLRARRVDGVYHLVTSNVRSLETLLRCCERSELKILDLHLNHAAAAEAVLAREEKRLGVCLADIGHGTVNVAVYTKGALVHTAVIRLGGGDLNQEIARELRITLEEAERIKVKYGCVHASLLKDGESFEALRRGGGPPVVLQRAELFSLLEPKAAEIVSCIRREMERVGPLSDLISGLVLTGGGASLAGLPELAAEICERLPVRVGEPRGLGGFHSAVRRPGFAAAAGVALLAAHGGIGPRSGARLGLVGRTLQRFRKLTGEVGP